MRQNTSFSTKIWYFMALLTGATISTAVASPEVSAYIFGDSLVDCLNSLKKPSDYPSRAEMAAADTDYVMRKAPYKGTPEQNRHMLKHYCPKASTGLYGKLRNLRHHKVSAALEREIIAGLRDTARAHGVDEVKFINTARCESQLYPRARGDTARSRGIFQIHRKHHPEVSDEMADNWQYSAHFAVRLMTQEGWYRAYKKDPSGKRIFIGMRWRSEAFQWTCYRNLYGRTSALVTPIPGTPASAIVPSGRTVALNGD